MSLFLESALPLAERGFRVFPLIPKTKRPVAMEGAYDHFDAASTDPQQIRLWGQQEPQANVGLSPDEIFCFLETDDEVALKEACADLPPGVWDTARVSARENRCYYIFRQTMRTRHAGNMTATREGQDNLFEFKQHRMYCTGPGSIHPKTGTPYLVDWRPIPAMPDVLLNRLCELYGAPKPGNKTAMSEETERQTELLDRFLAVYEVPTTGDWFNKGKQWYRPIECPWGSEHENANAGTSTCVLYTENGGYGFDCKHRCSSKGWKEFRAELGRRFPERRFSFVEDGPGVALGTRTPEKLPESAKQIRPVYPMDAWRGTVVHDFAELCGADNNVPLKLYAEAFRCVLGAIVGDQIACPNIEGVTPRTYTVLVVPFGKGKGTAIGRAMSFFEQVSGGGVIINGRRPGGADTREALLTEKPFPWQWATEHVGAWVAGASSAPGMAKLANMERPKPKREKDKPEPPAQPPLWGGDLPRVLSVFEEAKNLFSSLSIEGGVGHATTGAICALWDSNRFYGTATGERAPASGRMLFSMLCGVTESDWFDLLGRGDIVGGGLMSRLNICGTMGEYANVSRLRPPDFNPLRRVFLPRIHELSNTPADIPASDDALNVVDAWAAELPAGSERMNVHVWRSALLLSWLRGESEITGDTAQDAVRLGDYQVATHEYYRTEATDNATAYIQQKMVRVLRSKGPLSRAALFKHTNGKRDGTVNWGRALDSMVQNGLFRVDGGKIFAAKAED